MLTRIWLSSVKAWVVSGRLVLDDMERLLDWEAGICRPKGTLPFRVFNTIVWDIDDFDMVVLFPPSELLTIDM